MRFFIQKVIGTLNIEYGLFMYDGLFCVYTMLMVKMTKGTKITEGSI